MIPVSRASLKRLYGDQVKPNTCDLVSKHPTGSVALNLSNRATVSRTCSSVQKVTWSSRIGVVARAASLWPHAAMACGLKVKHPMQKRLPLSPLHFHISLWVPPSCRAECMGGRRARWGQVNMWDDGNGGDDDAAWVEWVAQWTIQTMTSIISTMTHMLGPARRWRASRTSACCRLPMTKKPGGREFRQHQGQDLSHKLCDTSINPFHDLGAADSDCQPCVLERQGCSSEFKNDI